MTPSPTATPSETGIPRLTTAWALDRLQQQGLIDAAQARRVSLAPHSPVRKGEKQHALALIATQEFDDPRNTGTQAHA